MRNTKCDYILTMPRKINKNNCKNNGQQKNREKRNAERHQIHYSVRRNNYSNIRQPTIDVHHRCYFSRWAHHFWALCARAHAIRNSIKTPNKKQWSARPRENDHDGDELRSVLQLKVNEVTQEENFTSNDFEQLFRADAQLKVRKLNATKHQIKSWAATFLRARSQWWCDDVTRTSFNASFPLNGRMLRFSFAFESGCNVRISNETCISKK